MAILAPTRGRVLRGATRRAGGARAGPATALPTARELEFRAAHAAARDAVHTPLDPAAVRAALPRPVDGARGGSRPPPDRATYLQRPDLGRRLAAGPALPGRDADLAHRARRRALAAGGARARRRCGHRAARPRLARLVGGAGRARRPGAGGARGRDRGRRWGCAPSSS